MEPGPPALGAWSLTHWTTREVLMMSLIYFYKFIYLFIFGCVGSSLLRAGFLSCDEQGLLFVAVCRLLVAVASLVAEHGL